MKTIFLYYLNFVRKRRYEHAVDFFIHSSISIVWVFFFVICFVSLFESMIVGYACNCFFRFVTCAWKILYVYRNTLTANGHKTINMLKNWMRMIKLIFIFIIRKLLFYLTKHQLNIHRKWQTINNIIYNY